MRQFLKIVQALPWVAEEEAFYQEIRHPLPPAGQLIGEMDTTIAAYSLAAAAVLVTNGCSALRAGSRHRLS